MGFNDFAVGQVFSASFAMTEDDFKSYLASARTRNILHENPELAAKEGIKGVLLPGRSVIARAEGEMTRLPEFSDCMMLLYGMDGDPEWGGRHTRFLCEVYSGEELVARYMRLGHNSTPFFSILYTSHQQLPIMYLTDVGLSAPVLQL